MNSLVKDIMRTAPVCLDKKANLETVNNLINIKGLSHIPVTTEGQLLGIVTKTDLIKKVIYILKNSSGKNYSKQVMHHIPVAEIMTPEPVTLNESDAVEMAIETLLKGKFHSLIVVDEQNMVKGMVTAFDLLKAKIDSNS